MTASTAHYYEPLAHEVDGFAKQEAINSYAATDGVSAEDVRMLCVETARTQLAKWAQHNAGVAAMADPDGPWKLVVFTKPVIGKGGLRFAEGDYALADMTPHPMPFINHNYTVTVYSTRGHVHCDIGFGNSYFNILT